MVSACFLTWDSPEFVSGLRGWLERLLPAIAKHDVAPQVLYLPTKSRIPGEHVQTLRAAGIPCVPLPRTIIKGTHSAIRAAVSALVAMDADVFVPSFWVPGYFAAPRLRTLGVSTVGVMHSDDPHYWALAERSLAGDAPCAISHWVAVSSELQRRLDQLATMRADVRTTLIRYVLERPPQTAQAATDKFRIGYFGRICTEQKRILDVARAMILLAKRFPQVACEIYGLGPQLNELQAYLTKHGAGADVRYLGALSPNESVRRMADMQSVLLLSDYEGLSCTLLESMSVGVPPISYDCASGTRDLIRHGENGFIVNDRDEQVVAAVGRMLAEPGLWERASHAAIETITGKFTIDGGAKAWAELIHAAAEPQSWVQRMFAPVVERVLRYSLAPLGLPPVHPAHGRALDRRSWI